MLQLFRCSTVRSLILCGGMLHSVCWAPLEGQSRQVPPKDIFGLYAPGKDRPRPGRDSIRVTSGDHGKVNLALKLYFANGHTCQLDKEGEWQGDHLIVIADGLNPDQACRLEASFSQGRIRLSDEGQRCAQVYCGTRGKLDGLSLPKRSR